MRKRLKLLVLCLIALLVLGGLFLLIQKLYAPTLRNIFLSGNKGELAKRTEFLTKVYPLIPLTEIPHVGSIKVVNLDTYQEEGPYVEVRNCVPFPYIRLTVLGEKVTFSNFGNRRKIIKLLGKQLFINPGARKTESISFPAVPALYPYTCDNSTQPAGFLYVVK